MLVIKNYIIDDSKIHAKIEENKKNRKKLVDFLLVFKGQWKKQKSKKEQDVDNPRILFIFEL